MRSRIAVIHPSTQKSVDKHLDRRWRVRCESPVHKHASYTAPFTKWCSSQPRLTHLLLFQCVGLRSCSVASVLLQVEQNR
jgi:hypothetical protein